MEQLAVVQGLAALAQPLRLQVFRALVVAGPQGLTPGAMSEGTGVPPNTLSFHLKELTHAGLVTQQRDGRYLIYRADFGRMNGLLAYLTENCCQGAGCLVDSACCPPTSTARRKP
jgi:ArsR family transcriptional regulator